MQNAIKILIIILFKYFLIWILFEKKIKLIAKKDTIKSGRKGPVNNAIGNIANKIPNILK